MTTSNPVLQPWATQPLGKAARMAIAVGGLVLATLVLMTAAIVGSGSWALVALGALIAPAAVRAARLPSTARLGVLAAVVLAVPFIIQAI